MGVHGCRRCRHRTGNLRESGTYFSATADLAAQDEASQVALRMGWPSSLFAADIRRSRDDLARYKFILH